MDKIKWIILLSTCLSLAECVRAHVLQTNDAVHGLGEALTPSQLF